RPGNRVGADHRCRHHQESRRHHVHRQRARQGHDRARCVAAGTPGGERMNTRVLVVDDDREMADTVAEYLTERGYRADTAVGGRAALQALKRKAFDAVITDLRMDGVDGLDVLEAARADDPTRPVLIMTAYGTIDGAIEAVRRGAAHYLTKPFKM